MEKVYVGRLLHSESIKLAEFNRERSKLLDAKRITLLHTAESIFLLVKETQEDLNMDLIKIQRKESSDWDHDFDENTNNILIIFLMTFT